MSEAKAHKTPRRSTARSVKQLFSVKHKTVKLSPALAETFGKPELGGEPIFYYGDTSQGKSHLTMQLVVDLLNNYRVFYNACEEPGSLSFKERLQQYGLQNTNGKRLLIGLNETLAALRARLTERYAPDVVILDSIQTFMRSDDDFTPVTWIDIKKLLADFPKVLFVIVSQSDDGKRPTGRPAQSTMFFAQFKGRVEGYRLFVKGSRNGGGKPYTIWAEGAEKYWSVIDKK